MSASIATTAPGWLPREASSGATSSAGGPLAGIRVLDFSELLPGPFLTQSLVDLGADVVKVERPPHGDNARRLAPAVFESVNRGKRSFLANLKDAASRDAVLALADEADVLVETYRPGAMARLGVGFDVVSARNARLVYVSLSGYGATGERALLPGHDLNYLAAAGVLALADRAEGGDDGGRSPACGVPMADLGGAVYALAALNAALVQRHRTGRGQHLDVSITDCMVHWLNPRLANFRHAGLDALDAQRRQVRERPAYGAFACSDGERVSIGALEDHFWASLARIVDVGPYADARYATYAARAPEACDINRRLAAAFATRSSDDVIARMTEADVPVARLAAPYDVVADPRFAERGLFVDAASGPLCRFPIRMDGMAVTSTTSASA